MCKELTVISVFILGLLADILCFNQTIDNPGSSTLFFTLEIFAAVFCVFLIYFFMKRIVIRRSQSLGKTRILRLRFSPVSLWKFDRSEFQPSFLERQTSSTEV